MNTSTLSGQIAKAGIGIVHHFGSGTYIKETRIPKGKWLEQHVHPFDHQSVLAGGKVMVEVDGEKFDYEGFAVILIVAGKVHRVHALENSTWLCIHATSETDPEKVDDAILAGREAPPPAIDK